MPVIDLTLTVRHGMRGVEFEQLHTAARHGYNTRTLHLYSHSGTHMDAPLHFAAGEGTIDQIPLDRCLGPAWVVDLAGIAPKTLITVSHLGDVANRVQLHDALLLRTGWSKYADDAAFYRDGLPRIAPDLAQWCVDRKLRLLGIEPPSVADVNNLAELTDIHRTLLAGGVIIVEGLANLDALTRERVFFAAVPLKIEAGDGSPCRAFAIESDELLSYHV